MSCALLSSQDSAKLNYLLTTIAQLSYLLQQVSQTGLPVEQIGEMTMRLIDAYKPQELATELGVSVHTLNTWRSRNKGPKFVRIAGRIHYMRTDVQEWIQSQINAA